MKNDSVIKTLPITLYGSEEGQDKAAQMLRHVFGSNYVKYRFGNKSGYKKLVKMLHGYVHGNSFSYRSALMREDKNSDLLSTETIKLGVTVVLLIETLITSIDCISNATIKLKKTRHLEQKKIVAGKFMSKLKSASR